MDSTVTLISEGVQEWILIPTTIRSEVNSILCRSLNAEKCKSNDKKKNKALKNITQWDFNEAWFDHVAPQLAKYTWNGRFILS